MGSKIITSILLILTLTTLSGCKSFSEVDNRYMVLGAAVDIIENDYVVTVEVVDVENSTTDSVVSKHYSAKGKSIFDAIRNTIKVSGKKLFWAYTKVIIISKDIAEQSVYPIIDWINRDQEPRDDIILVVSRENTAKEIIEFKPTKTSIPSNLIKETIENYKFTPKYAQSDISEFIFKLTTPGIEPIASAIKISKEDTAGKLEVDGTAVFLNYTLMGFLDDNESMNLLILMNKLQDGLIHLDKNTSDLNTDLDIEVFRSKTKIKPTIVGGSVIVEIEVNPQLGLALTEKKLDFLNENVVKQIKYACDRYLEKDIARTINNVQDEYKSDIFGFGYKINISYPSLWKDLKPDWNNKFSSVKFLVKSDSEILGSGLISNSLKEE